MEKELDPDIIKATQTSLGKYVKRPPLSEKLLRKPPFRFLHDIVTSVLKNTGFFEGLFEPEELISDNVKDRESKILFLNKVITVVGLATGNSLAIKSSKIVAGQEVDKTNELLQCLASALDKKISSDEAVKRYKENGAKLPTENDRKAKETTKTTKEKEKKAVDVKKLASKSNEKLTTNKKEGQLSVKNNSDGKNNNKISQKDNKTKNESLPRKTSQQSKTTSKKGEVKKEKVHEQHSQKIENLDKNDKNNHSNSLADNLNASNNQKDSTLLTHSLGEQVITNEESPLSIDNNQQYLDVSSTAENQLNSSLSSQDLMEVDGENLPRRESLKDYANMESESVINLDLTSDDRSSSNNISFKTSIDKNETTIPSDNSDVNQMSNSNAVIKLDDQKSSTNSIISNDVKNNEVDEMETVTSPVSNNNHRMARPKSVRPSSSRPGAPRLRDKHDNILTESENLIVGKVNIIAENTPLEEEEDSSMIIIEQEKSLLPVNSEQEQFTVSSKPHGHLVQQILDSQKEFSQVAGKTEIEWEFGAQKAREAVNKEIEQLRYNIQGLSRVANPLGKILDHIQEDVEVMRQELQQWTKTYVEASKELLKQKTLNEDSMFPLRAKVNQLEVDIKEKHEKINDLKVVIHKNSSRIEKLLASGDVQ